MLLRIVLLPLWLALALGWYQCIASLVHMVGGSQWLEVNGMTRYVIPLGLMSALCVLAGLVLLILGRLPTLVLLAVGVPAFVGLLSGITLSIHLDYNSSPLAIAFDNVETLLTRLIPMHTSFLGSPPGNAWPLLVPGGTLVVLFGSFLAGKRASPRPSNA